MPSAPHAMRLALLTAKFSVLALKSMNTTIKFFKLGLSAIALTGMLSGCGTTETPEGVIGILHDALTSTSGNREQAKANYLKVTDEKLSGNFDEYREHIKLYSSFKLSEDHHALVSKTKEGPLNCNIIPVGMCLKTWYTAQYIYWVQAKNKAGTTSSIRLDVTCSEDMEISNYSGDTKYPNRCKIKGIDVYDPK